MNEEIDIIELLKRVKEGNAPKEIEIDKEKFYLNNYGDISCKYLDIYKNAWFKCVSITFDNKIKILDKPIIEELSEVEPFDDNRALIIENRDKINEIIKWINNKE